VAGARQGVDGGLAHLEIGRHFFEGEPLRHAVIRSPSSFNTSGRIIADNNTRSNGTAHARSALLGTFRHFE
jgi:hypothetical protein